jgi:hypothetical protein
MQERNFFAMFIRKDRCAYSYERTNKVMRVAQWVRPINCYQIIKFPSN